MTEWTWTSINYKELAKFVTPSRATDAVGGSPRAPGATNHDLISEHKYETVLEAIYSRLLECRIEYNIEPFNYDDNSQRVRPPEVVVGSDTVPGEGTCLDLALVAAGLCLERRLRPIVVVFKAHAMVLVSRVDSNLASNPFGRGLFGTGSCEDYTKIFGLVTDDSFVPIECTAFAVTTTDASRDATGQHDYAGSKKLGLEVMSGDSSLGGNDNFRFAIEPQQLFEAGIEPNDQPDTADRRLVEFRRGTYQAGDAIASIIDSLPAGLQGHDAPQLEPVKLALAEVLRTYDIVHTAAKGWLQLAHANDFDDQARGFVSALTSGELTTQIASQRGHCGLIGEFYHGGGSDTLRLLVNDPDGMSRIDAAFDHLIGADYAFFDQAAAVGESITEAAIEAYDLLLADDIEGAKQRVKASASEIGSLQRAVGANRSDLYRLSLALFGNPTAVPSEVSLPPRLQP